MGFQVTTSGSGGGGTPTQLYYPVTYAQAASAVSGSSVVRGATYFITDRNVELTGVAVNAFSLEGRFLRSGEWNFIEYDFDNDHIQLEVDDRGNRVGCTQLALDYGIVVTDPRTIFRWGDALVLNNTVWNAEFDCASSTGQVFGNTILTGSIVELSGDGNFFNNTVESTSEITATGFTGSFSLNKVSDGSTIDLASSSVTTLQSVFSQGSTIDLTGHTGTINNFTSNTGTLTASNTAQINAVRLISSELTVSGTASLGRSEFTAATSAIVSGSTVLSDGIFSNATIAATGGTASELFVKDSGLTLAGTAQISGTRCTQNSTLDVSGTVSATDMIVSSNSTVTLSGSTVAANLNATQGSTVTATGGSANSAWVQASTLNLSDSANVDGIKLLGGSTANISESAEASNAQLNQGNTLTASGTADCIGVYMTTGASCTASGSVMIEGLIIRNVSVCTFSDSVICSPGEIENQSTINLSGTGNYGNCFWKGVSVTGSGSVTAVNCNLYQIESVVFDDCGDVRNACIKLQRGVGNVGIRFESSQTNQYVDFDSSNKRETFAVVANAIDFDAADINHYVGEVIIDSTSTINTINNITKATGAAPRCFRITPTSGNTITFASATATNIVLPNGVTTVTANGTNGDWIEFEHDGTNAYITEINNF